MKPAYILGLDLGQTSDPSALAVVETRRGPDPAGRLDHVQHYAVRHLERYQLGTPYPRIVDSVSLLSARPPLPGCTLVADQTGVGRPVVDMFRARRLPCLVRAVTITSGHQITEEGFDFRVPKKELVGVMQSLLQSGRLKVARSLPLAGVLEKELGNFKVKVTQAANEVFGAWREGENDDLVLAVALAVWLGEREPPVQPEDLRSTQTAEQRSPFASPPAGVF